MNILEVLAKNFSRQPRSRQPQDKVECPVEFRGVLEHEPDLCTLCGTCSYACSPGAIQIERGAESGAWIYDAGRCTFCARCVEYCPTGALRMLEEVGANQALRQTQLTTHPVPYQHCERCGVLMLPMPAGALMRLYHTDSAAQEAAPMHRLCEKCRAREHSKRFKPGFSSRLEE